MRNRRFAPLDRHLNENQMRPEKRRRALDWGWAWVVDKNEAAGAAVAAAVSGE
jgi:hypothetical protein